MAALLHFGGAEVDMRNAILSPEGAFLDILVAFGGIDLRVHRAGRLQHRAYQSLEVGKTKPKSYRDLQPAAPVLNVRCLAAFGGIEIMN